MKNIQIFTWLLSTTLMLACITQSSAQDLSNFLKPNNQYIQSRLEKSDPAGWVYLKESSKVIEGEMFSSRKDVLGLGVNDSMLLIKQSTDEQNITHNKYQQYFKSLLVEGGEMFEHIQNCNVVLVNGKVIERLNLDVLPNFSESQALNLALNQIGASLYAWQSPSMEQEIKEDNNDPSATWYPKGKLMLSYPLNTNLSATNYVLAWKFEIISVQPQKNIFIYVNAKTGSVFKTIDKVLHNGPAGTFYDGIQTVDSRWFGGFHDHHHLHTNEGGRNIVTKGGTLTSSWNALGHITNDNDDIWTAGVQTSTNTAHWVTSQAWDFYKNTYNRNGLRNTGSEVRVVGGSALTFNAGFGTLDGKDIIEYGTTLTPLGPAIPGAFGLLGDFATLDIAGHELTHGVIDSEAALTFAGESGALNESFADIFGVMVERYARGGSPGWTLGEDIGVAVRNFMTPALGLSPQPETYSTDPLWFNTVGCIPTSGLGGNDLCGVHTNSGVQNKWFYLLSDGGTQNGVSVSGIGADKAAKIAYYNLVYQLGSGANHPAARAGAIAAARQIFGACSNEEIQTTNAWAAVGVDAPFSGPCITLSGLSELCVKPMIGTPTFRATGIPSATFTWSFPSSWTTHTTGLGNRNLVITNISNYPSYPVFETISVTSSLGGTASMTVELVDDCGPDHYLKCGGDFIGEERNKISNSNENQYADITIYPNPAEDKLFINSNGVPINNLRLYDISGRLILEQPQSKDINTAIDISKLIPCSYFIVIQLDNESVTKRFAKLSKQ